MDPSVWQTVVTWLCVTAAVVVLVRRALALFRRQERGCGGGCSSCPSSKRPELTTLEDLRRS